MTNFQLFQNIQTFFLGSFLAEVRRSGLQACNVSEKEDFWKYFLGLFEILENSFLSELFEKNICSGVFRSALCCRLCSCNRIKKELYSTTYIFLDIFKVFGAAISTYPHKTICNGVYRVPSCTRDILLKLFEMKSCHKNSVIDSYSGSNL